MEVLFFQSKIFGKLKKTIMIFIQLKKKFQKDTPFRDQAA